MERFQELIAEAKKSAEKCGCGGLLDYKDFSIGFLAQRIAGLEKEKEYWKGEWEKELNKRYKAK